MPSRTPLAPRTGAVFHGVYADSGVAAFETAAGKTTAVEGWYEQWATSTGFNTTRARSVQTAGRINLITWEPWDPTAGVTQSAYALANITAGNFDAYLRTWADGCKAFGEPIFLRFAQEMNGDWYPWGTKGGVNGNTAADYVAAWQHVRGVFTARGVTNVTWVWSPNRPFTGSTAMSSLYPGASYVDWLGLDAYNGTNGFESVSAVFDAGLTELAGVTTTKPVMIAETAATETGGNKATWIGDYFTALAATYTQVRGIMWFNFNKETDWRIQSSTAATTAYATGIGNSRYAGTQATAFTQASTWSPPVSASTPAGTVTLAPDNASSATRSDTVAARYKSAWSSTVSATTLAGAASLTVNSATSVTTADGAASASTSTGFGAGGFGQGGFGGINSTSGAIILTFHAAVTPPPPPVTPPVAPDIPSIGRVVVEVGFNTDPTVNGGQYLHWGDPVRGRWGTGRWAPDNVWTDVTPWLQTCSWQRGANRVEGPVIRYEAGTATVVLNNADGRFHPLNLTGPYVSAGVTQVRPMVPVRIRGTYNGQYWPIWQGYADNWDVVYSSPLVSSATVTCTDAQKIFGSKNRTASLNPASVGELSGARVHRIADSAGWPTNDRLIDTGQSVLQGTTLEGDPWAELLLVQDTEIGEVYIDAAGRLVFKDRHAVLTEPLSTTSQAIFGRFGQSGELPYVDLEPAYDDADLRNVVRIAREGGVTQEARDDTSVFQFLEHTFERTDLLMQTDQEAANYAGFLLSQSKDPEVRFRQITVNPAAQPDDLWPQVFGRDFGDRITIRSRPPGVGLVERDVFIRGIAGSYAGINRLTVTWTLQPASRKTGLVWGTGRWGAKTSTWAY